MRGEMLSWGLPSLELELYCISHGVQPRMRMFRRLVLIQVSLVLTSVSKEIRIPDLHCMLRLNLDHVSLCVTSLPRGFRGFREAL